MTLREKLLYHHFLPVKVAADASALIIAAALLWQQHLLRAVAVGIALPVGTSIFVLWFAAEETWSLLRSGRHRSLGVTAIIVLVRTAAAFVFWAGAWYRSLPVCVIALAAGALTWADIRVLARPTGLTSLWSLARRAALVLPAVERYKNAIAAAALAFCLIDLVAFYVGGHPFRAYLIENSDLLYLPALFSDVMSKGGHLSDWYLTPAPYFFPDYPTYFVAYIVGSTSYVQIVLFSIAQILLTVSVIWLLARGLSRSGAFVSAVTTTIVLIWLAINAGEPFVMLLAGASHFGSFISALLLAALWMHYHTATSVGSRRVRLGAMCILAFVATLSDNLFIVYATLPLVVTVMAAAVTASGAASYSRASRTIIVSASMVLAMVVPVLLYRAPVPPPSVNVAWSPMVSDQQRSALEARFHLVDGDFRGGQLWIYRLADWSRANVSALVRDPAVADTQHIDRQSLTVDGTAGPLQRALMAVPLGGALAAFAMLSGLFVILLGADLCRGQAIADKIASLLPAMFSALGSLSYGFVVANPTRYPLAVGLEKTYGNLTDLLRSFSGAIMNHPLYGAIFVANVVVIGWVLSRREETSAGERSERLASLAAFGGASICFTLIALSLITDLPVMPRYLIPAFCWPVVMLTLFLRHYLGRRYIAAAATIAVLAALSVSSHAYTLVNRDGVRPRYYSAELACIDNALADHGLTNGIAQYWDAKYLQQFSRLDLNVAQYLENLEEMRWITSKRYFKRRYDFAVVDETAEPTYRISIEALNRINGPAAATFSCGSRTLYIFGKDKLRTAAAVSSGGSP